MQILQPHKVKQIHKENILNDDAWSHQQFLKPQNPNIEINNEANLQRESIREKHQNVLISMYKHIYRG